MDAVEDLGVEDSVVGPAEGWEVAGWGAGLAEGRAVGSEVGSGGASDIGTA